MKESSSSTGVSKSTGRAERAIRLECFPVAPACKPPKAARGSAATADGPDAGASRQHEEVAA
jgi:hypothetical protein